MYRKKNQLLEMGICLIDMAVVLASIIMAGCIRYTGYSNWKMVSDVKLVCGAVALIHVTLFYFLKITDGFFRRGRYRELLICLQYSVLMVAGITFFGFVIRSELLISRLMMAYFFGISTALMWIVHILIRNKERIFKTGVSRQENLLVVTTSDRVSEIMETFLHSKEMVWHITGIILMDRKEHESYDDGIPVLGRKDDYAGFASKHAVDEVFIQIDSVQKNEKLLQHMILEFEKMGLVVNLNLDLFNLGFSGEKRIYPLEGYNVIAFSSRLLDYRIVLIKRAMDIIGAIIGLIITFVVGIVLAPFLLLESPGPLIFKQKRVGRNGREFEIYKFRSMYVDAEERKKDLMDQNEMSGLMFKMENDPRVTKVGKFIRKTSIDELPQFWNVLKGDMSLVGTRPPTVDEFQQYEPYQRRRISFRPGITGLWQVSGRSTVKDFEDVVKLDLEYIDNWSIALDIKILCKTVWVVLRGEGAE